MERKHFTVSMKVIPVTLLVFVELMFCSTVVKIFIKNGWRIIKFKDILNYMVELVEQYNAPPKIGIDIPIELIIKIVDILSNLIWAAKDDGDEMLGIAEALQKELSTYIESFRTNEDCEYCASYLYKIKDKYYCPCCEGYF